MTATQSDILQIASAVLLLIFCSYAGGRVHQWYRQSFERDLAFREGYQQASHTLFPLASRSLHGRVTAPEGRTAESRSVESRTAESRAPESRVPAARVRPRDPFDDGQ